MKVKLISDEVTYYRKSWESVVEINGKQVRVYSYQLQDNQFDNYEAEQEPNEEDMAKLTDEEADELESYLDDILAGKEGEEWDTEGQKGVEK